jgi:hypothetical protein
VLSAARVVGSVSLVLECGTHQLRRGWHLPARIFAGVICAGGYTLGSPLGANVVWYCLRVLGDVRSDVVFADAGVGKSILSMSVDDLNVCIGIDAHRIALVLNSSHASNTRLLEADQRALGLLVVTPCF